MNMFKVTTAIRAILAESPDIKMIVGGKIYPIIAPENTEGDFLVYQRDGYNQEYTQMGVARQSPIVFVSAISDDYAIGQELASLIYDALSGDFRDPDMTIKLEDSTEDFIDNKYIQVLKFSISSI